MSLRRVVYIEGARTPFARSFTEFFDVSARELLRHALAAVINRSSVPKSTVQYVTTGITMPPLGTNNIARDGLLAAGFDSGATQGHAVTMACISSNQAITSIASQIQQGHIDCGIGSGLEALSDPPICIPRKTRSLLFQLNKAKTGSQRARLLLKVRLSHFGIDVPAIAEFSTKETMGQSCDRLTADFGVSRREQDEFGLRSHDLADKAQKEGLLSDVEPMIVKIDGAYVLVEKDNGIRTSNLEKVSRLKPAFTKTGTATASSSSFITDGASATLLMSECKAKRLGLKPKVVIKDYNFVAIDPKKYLLLGPAHATAKLLTKNGMTLEDIDVFEYHEAFSGQVLANIKAMDTEIYVKNEIGSKPRLGSFPLERLNAWGGSVSLGHPFGATGSRLFNMCANRLIQSGGELGLISGCAAGGLGHAMVIERIN